MSSEYLCLTAYDRKFLSGLRIAAGETVSDKLQQFAEALEERRQRAQNESWLDSDAAE